MYLRITRVPLRLCCSIISFSVEFLGWHIFTRRESNKSDSSLSRSKKFAYFTQSVKKVSPRKSPSVNSWTWSRVRITSITSNIVNSYIKRKIAYLQISTVLNNWWMNWQGRERFRHSKIYKPTRNVLYITQFLYDILIILIYHTIWYINFNIMLHMTYL